MDGERDVLIRWRDGGNFLEEMTGRALDDRSERQSCRVANPLHKEAAASTAPAALKVFLLVKTTSTGYFHSMNLAQPVLLSAPIIPSSNLLRFPIPSHSIPNQTRTEYLQKLTPISALAAKILAGVRHQHHGQDELELLQRLLPLLLGVRVGFRGGVVDVVAGGGVGEGVDFGGGGGGLGGRVAGVDVLGGGGGGGHFGGWLGWWRGFAIGGRMGWTWMEDLGGKSEYRMPKLLRSQPRKRFQRSAKTRPFPT